MAAPDRVKVYISQGETFLMDVTLNLGGSAVDLTGLTGADITFRLATAYGVAATYTTDLDGAIEITDASAGQFRVFLPSTATADFAAATHVYEVTVDVTVGGEDQQLRVLQGDAVVTPRVGT